jgi:hypothetical protein
MSHHPSSHPLLKFINFIQWLGPNKLEVAKCIIVANLGNVNKFEITLRILMMTSNSG